MKLLRGAKQASLLQLELVELSLAVHLDNERDNEHEEGGADDPRGFSGALEEFLGHKGGVGRRFLASVHDWGLRHGGGHARQNSGVG